MDDTVCGRCSVSKITQFRRCIFSIFFVIWSWKIALAIPASNDKKYNWNNSAGQELKIIIFVLSGQRVNDCIENN